MDSDSGGSQLKMVRHPDMAWPKTNKLAGIVPDQIVLDEWPDVDFRRCPDGRLNLRGHPFIMVGTPG